MSAIAKGIFEACQTKIIKDPLPPVVPGLEKPIPRKPSKGWSLRPADFWSTTPNSNASTVALELSTETVSATTNPETED